jgi:hypothetical protein
LFQVAELVLEGTDVFVEEADVLDGTEENAALALALLLGGAVGGAAAALGAAAAGDGDGEVVRVGRGEELGEGEVAIADGVAPAFFRLDVVETLLGG